VHHEDGGKLHRIVCNYTNLHGVISQKSSVFKTALEAFKSPMQKFYGSNLKQPLKMMWQGRPPDVAYGSQRIDAREKN